MSSTSTTSWPCHPPRMASPLSDEEIFELEAFLMENRDASEAMMFVTMGCYGQIDDVLGKPR
jgi:hypothetical protein